MQIICSRAGVEKISTIYDLIQALPKNSRAYLVVPEQYTFTCERKLFDVLSTNTVMNIQVISMQRLAYLISPNKSFEDKKILSDDAKALIIQDSIHSVSERLRLFKHCSDKYTFSEHIQSMISEFKKNVIDLEMLKDIKNSQKDINLINKLEDACLLYECYQERLQGEYIDAQDYLAEASKHIKSFEGIENITFFFDSFHSFDKSDYTFLEQIIIHSKKCYFTLTHDEINPFWVSKNTLNELENICTQNDIECEKKYIENNVNARAEIAHLEMNYFKDEPCVFPGKNNSIHCFEAETLREEVRAVAIKITNLIKKENLRYKDFLICVSDMKKYSQIITEVFYEYGLELFLDERKKIVFSAPIKALLFLLDTLDRTPSTQDYIGYAKTGFSSVEFSEIEDIENYTLEFGIKGYFWTKEFNRNNRFSTYDLDAINQTRLKIINSINLLKSKLKSVKTTSEACEQILQYLIESGFNDKIKQIVADFEFNQDYEQANIYSQIFNKIINILKQTYDFFLNDKCDLGKLSKVITYALVSTNIGVIPSIIDRIQVCDILRSRSSGSKRIFILGANEGLLPSTNSQTMIFTDSEFETLLENGLNVLSTNDYMRQKELFVLYNILACASEEIYISRFKQDETAICDASEVFNNILKMFPDCLDSNISQIDTVCNLNTSIKAVSLDLSLRKQLKSDNTNPIIDNIYHYLKDYHKESYEQINSGLHFSNSTSLTKKSEYKKLFSENLTFSISRLENYALCPFGYFIEHIIHPQERKIFKIEAFDIGNVMHTIIELYSKKIIADEIDVKSITEEEINSIVLELIDEVFSQYSDKLFEFINQKRYIKSKLTRASLLVIKEITRQLSRSDFFLKYTEAEFGKNSIFPPIIVDIENYGRVFIRGKIDRVDILEKEGQKYLKVIDYKTGSNIDIDFTKIYYGLSLQLPVYLKAITNDKMNSIAGAFYMSVRADSVNIKKNLSIENVKKELKANMRLKGITLDELDIIHAIDNDVEVDSFIKNLKIKDDELTASSDVADCETLNLMVNNTFEHIKNLSKNIIDGEVGIHPTVYKGKKKCTHCKIKQVCKISKCFDANSPKYIPKEEKANIYDLFKVEEKYANMDAIATASNQFNQ